MGTVFKRGNKKLYEAVSIARGDLLEMYESKEKMVKKIKQLNDKELSKIADNFGKALKDDDWDELLRAVFESMIRSKEI